jgi:hypothetical protein
MLPAVTQTAPRIGRPPKHLVFLLAVGESMFIAATPMTMKSLRYQHAPKRFKARRVMVNGVIGYRVLRIA